MATDFLVKQGRIMGGVRLVTDADVAHQTDLTNIIQTGATSSQAISSGTYFYLNDVLVKAKVDIANGATFTLNTNYEVVTAGGLNELNNKFNYSETEQYGGKWIDGSDWYYKTINCGGIPNSTTKTVAHNISNLKNIIEVKGIAIRENTAWYPLPFNNVSNVNANIAIDVNTTNILIRTAIDYSVFTQSYVTLRYTKSS